ncbi:hypothetical protein Q9L42_021080 (plasmid) [Methylomarinum sp. Ch1-1]|uniref:Uncharacterized protein n=1 Tax=Methylomarinum roseum TaxID=3067653 RepID=A0AAU7P0T3_9GAMM|nr:hypothetical protein [Methylomarinum sp. Ch1-1]MDP4523148.1 hypothetical protein [Methylomarinum sp. Ch1-1]
MKNNTQLRNALTAYNYLLHHCLHGNCRVERQGDLLCFMLDGTLSVHSFALMTHENQVILLARNVPELKWFSQFPWECVSANKAMNSIELCFSQDAGHIATSIQGSEAQLETPSFILSIPCCLPLIDILNRVSTIKLGEFSVEQSKTSVTLSGAPQVKIERG